MRDLHRALALALIGCAALARAEPDDVTVGTPLPLTAKAPSGILSVTVPAPAPRAVVLAVGAVDNPARQGVALEVTLEQSGAAGTVRHALGTVALYPTDRPAAFTLELPEAAREQLAREHGSVQLRIRLHAAAAEAPLDAAVRITISPPTWR